ncbi:MAG TPA: adenosine deaminase [Ktedonobacterales bacterium]|nr:adenosine deaminase [Ktedonobacterales bacterium]
MVEQAPPRLDLHRHLDGSIRPRTVLELAQRFDVGLPRDLDALLPLIQVTDPAPDLMAYLAKMDRAVSVLGDEDACARIAYEAVEDARSEGIVYLEGRFSPAYMARAHGLDPAGVTAAVCDGAARGARDCGVRVNLIGILSRTFGPEATWRELEALLTQRERLVALDLAGDEARMPGELFVEHFRRGRDTGWHITVHAGEAGGAQSVWTAINMLGAERIGHGVRAVDDPALLDTLAERGIGIEMNLTSNVQTSTVPSYMAHPLRAYLERGLLATINTDDPAISAITLGYELERAAPAAGLTPQQVCRAQEHALTTAFLSADEKRALWSAVV